MTVAVWTGVTIIKSAKAERVVANEEPSGEHCVELSNGIEVSGHEILLAVGRTAPLDDEAARS